MQLKLTLKLRVTIWSRTTHTYQIFLKGPYLAEKIERDAFDLFNLKRKIVSFNILFHLILHVLPYISCFIVSYFNLFYCIWLQLILLYCILLQLILLYLTSTYFIVSYFSLFYCILLQLIILYFILSHLGSMCQKS